MKHYVMKPKSGWGFLDIREWIEFSDLFFILILRDIQLRYKQTVLGVFWVILQPLVTSCLFALIFGRITTLSDEGIPYLLFAFGGMLPWFTFSQGIIKASNSLLAQTQLISKVYFPRIIIPAASSAAVLLDFSIHLVTVVVLMFYYKISLTINFLFIPFFTLILFLYSTVS